MDARELDDLQHRLAALFGRGPIRPPSGKEEALTVAEWAPLVDIVEHDTEYLIKAELPGQRAGDLRHFERVGQPGAVMIALVEHEDLGFVLQAAKCGGMDHPVAIAPERAAGLARRLGKQPPAAAFGVAGID